MREGKQRINGLGRSAATAQYPFAGPAKLTGLFMSDELEDDVKAISMLLAVLRPLDAETRVHVLEFVLKRLGISLTAQPGAPPHKPGISDLNLAPPTPATPALQGSVDIRSFAAEKAPKTVNEKVALIGYYLAHFAPASERRDYLVAQDRRKTSCRSVNTNRRSVSGGA
jgi:hypothetical protein